MRYCGIIVAGDYQHLCALEEVREPEPPIVLRATFYEPGGVEDVAAEVRAADAVTAVAAPTRRPRPGRNMRVCDAELRRRGVFPLDYEDGARRVVDALGGRSVFVPTDASDTTAGVVEEGAYREAPVFETHPDAVFCALQGIRVPAKRHPFGMQVRIDELLDEHVEDDGGELWYRRIEEIDAAAAALCAHRYAVGHASWVGDPDEAVIVLPGSQPPDSFTSEGVVPPVPRRPLRRLA